MIVHPRGLDIVLTTWEGGGNLPPVLGAARRLLARGHRVRIMSDAIAAADVHGSGAEFRAWHRAPSRADRLPASDPVRDWEAETDLGGFISLRDRIMCGPALAYARDLADELERRPADVIVSSEMLFGVMAASEAARTPLALLCSNISLFPLPGLPPMGLGLRPPSNDAERAEQATIGREFGALLNEGLPPVNAARSFFRLPPIGDLAVQIGAAQRILLATSPAFDFEPDFLPQPFRYVGPLLDEPTWARTRKGKRRRGAGRPLILVAFSSSFQDQLGALGNVAKALAGAKFDAAPNVTVVDAASHDELMTQAAVVVTHAGHGTVMRALAHGVPLLCMPMGRDQHDNAVRVAARGAGLTLDRHAQPESIRDALRQLLDQPRFAASARALSRRIAENTGMSDLVAEIEEIATASPCRRAVNS